MIKSYIDINADLGEIPDGRDALIMPYISSCNIACGGHTGNIKSMEATLYLAIEHKVNIGAHPSYPDPVNFGRHSMKIERNVLKKHLSSQVEKLSSLALGLKTKVQHVKAHGAYYNDLCKNAELAADFVDSVHDLDSSLWVFGMPGTCLEFACQRKGLRFFREGFMDRSYQNSTSLQPRIIKGSVYTAKDQILKQLNGFIKTEVWTQEQGLIKMDVDTICLHGDSANAKNIGKALQDFLKEKGVALRSYA